MNFLIGTEEAAIAVGGEIVVTADKLISGLARLWRMITQVKGGRPTPITQPALPAASYSN
jgi:hypothetical protein